MKKILALFLAILMFVCVFSSCDTGTTDETLDFAENQTEKDVGKTENNSNGSLTEDNGNGSLTDCSHKDDDKNHLCDNCNDKMNDCADENKDHKCDICGENTSQHDYQNGSCKICGEEFLYGRNEKKITFGYYPQTEVTDSALISALNNAEPYASNYYNYYMHAQYSQYSSWMWYKDVELNGERYRGVEFTSYRPYYPMSESSSTTSYQGWYGYTTNTVYWFKYEPISWTVISEDISKGTALLVCDMIIDSQQYDYSNYDSSKGYGNYSDNNYEKSTIRKWLNNDFYNTAFGENQKKAIVTTKVDNSAKSTGISTNNYACRDTNDNVFLVSRADIANKDYGLGAEQAYYALPKQTTDYAQIQGIYSYEFNGNGSWWLRSPDHTNADCVCAIDPEGAMYYDMAYVTSGGIVPALTIKL